MRQQEQMQKLTEATQDRELLVRQFARDYGFNYSEINTWLQGRGMTPVSRPSTQGGDEEEVEPFVDAQDGQRRASTPAQQAQGTPQIAGQQRSTPSPASSLAQRIHAHLLSSRSPAPKGAARRPFVPPDPRRRTRFWSISTPEPESDTESTRRSLFQEPDDVAQAAVEAGVRSNRFRSAAASAAGALGSAAGALGGAAASAGGTLGSMAVGAATSALVQVPDAARGLGQVAGAVLGAAPGVLVGGYNVLSAMGEGITDGLVAGATFVPIPALQQQQYGFRQMGQPQGLYSELMSPAEIFEQQQMDLRMNPQSYAYLDANQAQLPQQLTPPPLIWQPEAFERQSGRTLTGGVPPPRSTASSSGYAPLPAPAPADEIDLEGELERMMDEEEAAAAAAAEPQNRRITGRRGIVTVMADIFDPAAQKSPDQRINTDVAGKATAVTRSRQQYDAMIDDMLRQLGKQTARSMTASSALRQIEGRLRPRDVNPNDPDNQRLVVTYYVIKTLLTRFSKPPSTDVRALLP